MTANNYAIKFTQASSDRADLTGTALGTTIKNLDTFTIECWIKVGAAATSTAQRFYLERQGAGKLPRLAGAAWNSGGKGKLRFEFSRRDNKNDTNYTYTLPNEWDDYWHHVAFSVNVGTKVYCIYLDGGLVLTGNISDGGLDGSSNPLKVTNTTPLGVFFGAHYDGTTYTYWDGKLDDFRLWNTVRSANDIQTNMFDHVLTSASGLVENWRFNTGSGSTASGAKNGTWTATLKRAGVASSALWTVDRAFMGDGNDDPTAPADFTALAPSSIGSDRFTFSWNSTTDNVYVQYYELTVATDNTFASPIAGYAAKNVGLDLSDVVTGLSPSTNYYARVRAVDAALNTSNYATYNSNAAITTTAEGDVTAPTTPVATAATSISDTAFTANWNASTDAVGVTGYKLDVAYDSAFASFVAGYRNLDVGNVLTKVVNVGIEPSTDYFYRVTAYDAAENESADSNTIETRTSDPPDTTAPDVVVIQPATSVAATSFTANWNVGVDNVAVVNYRLDISQLDDFSTFVTGYQNRSVGNVTSFGVTGLSQLSGYYYRVRAVDAAGNTSADTDDPAFVTTTPLTVEEGGLHSALYDVDADTYVNQAASGTNYGASTSLVVDGTASNVKRAYVKFDLSEVIGTIVNANLSIYVSDASTGTVSIKLVTAGTWDEATLTYATDTLTLGSLSADFVPSATGWYEIDVAPLLDGLAPAAFTFAVTTTSTDPMTFDSSEGTNIPTLLVETDPTSTTEVRTFTVTGQNTTLTNLLKNPSAEIGGTAFGGATGITALVGATLLQDNTYAYHGTYSCKVSTSASTNTGVKFESATGLGIAGTGQTLKGAFYARMNSFVGLRAKIRLTYTDLTTTDGTEKFPIINTDWRRFECSVVATSGKTIDKVELHVYYGGSDLFTFWIDAAIVAQVATTTSDIMYFDGSFANAEWNGTANASSSDWFGASVAAVATYVGDGDGDNSVVADYRRTDSVDWIAPDALIVANNRGTKQASATIGPLYRTNVVPNPSFTNDTTGWTTSGASGTTLSRLTTDGADSAELACLQVVGTGAVVDQGALMTTFSPAGNGQKWSFSLYAKSLSGETDLVLSIFEINNPTTILVTHTQTITLTTEWARYSLSTTFTSASTELVRARISNPTATAATFLIDHVQLEQNATVTPYIDGDQDDGVWSGIEHASASYRVLSHEVDYTVRFTFTDTDGVTGTNPYAATATTPHIPDNAVTTAGIALTAENTAISVVASYDGDENETATARVEWKRSDQATWKKVLHVITRANRTVSAYISNLKPGTLYDARVTFYDTTDGVHGLNPLTASATTTTVGLSSTGKPRITFGGFVLMGDGQDDVWVVEHDAYGLPERRTQVEDLPRMDGAAELSDYWGRRTVTMRGGVKGINRADLQDRIRELRAALAPRQQRLIVDTLDNRGYYLTGTCTSLGIGEVGGETIYHVLWDAEITCADPFRYATEETVEENITLGDTETVVIANDGDLDVAPVFTLTTASTSNVTLSLVNTTTGDRLKPSTTITNGDKLIIDSSRLRVTKNGVQVDFEGGFPHLSPGQNTLKMYTSPNRDIKLTIRRRHRYL